MTALTVFLDIDLSPQPSGYFAYYAPNTTVTDPTDGITLAQNPQAIVFNGTEQSVTLYATDNPNMSPAGWGYGLSFSQNPLVPGNPVPLTNFQVPVGPLAYTATSASPCVVTPTYNSTFLANFPNGLPNGTGVEFLSGAPAGFSEDTTYYVVGGTATTLELAATRGGSAINSTGTGSGTLQVTRYAYSGLAPLAQAPVVSPYLVASEAGAQNGIAQLDGSSQVPYAQVAKAAPGTVYLDQYTGTDDQKMASALSAVFAGDNPNPIIRLSARAHTFASQWSTAYAADVVTALHILGAGVAYNGAWGAPTAATTCTFTYSGTSASCIDIQHIGSIEIEGVQFLSANVGVPLFQTTNATPNIHDNVFSGGGSGTTCATDAIVLGGTGTSAGAGDTAKYNAYQGQVYRNFFDGIRRIVHLQSAANSVQVHDNTISITCGSNLYLGAPFEIGATSPETCVGNAIYGNCIEGSYYPVAGVKCTAAALENTLGPNGIFDTSAVNYCCYWFDDAATSKQNTVIDGYHAGTTPFAYDPANMNTICSQTSVVGNLSPQLQVFRGGMICTANGGPTGILDNNGNKATFSPGAGVSQAYPEVQLQVTPPTQVTDASTISGSKVVTSVTAAWTSADIGEVIGGSGISSNTFIAWVYTPSTALPWQASYAYLLGAVAAPTSANGHLYQCTTAGTTGSSQPTWPTSGGTVTDGGAVWTDLGTSATAAMITKAATATATGVTVSFSRAGTVVTMTGFGSHHIVPSGSVPTAVAETDAGSGATCTVAGTDIAHQVTLTTGTGPSAGLLFEITFALPFAARPLGLSVTPENAAAATLLADGYFVNTGTTNWTFYCSGAPAASTESQFLVIVI